MAAGRRRLTGLVVAAAAAKPGRSSCFCSTYHSSSPAPSPSPAPSAQHSFFSSWLERNVDCPILPSTSTCPFALGAIHHSLASSSYGPSDLPDLAPASTPASCRSSLCSPPSKSQSIFCPTIDFSSLLCISDVKAEEQTHVLEPSTKGESCNFTRIQSNNSSLNQHSSWTSQEVVNWPNAISFGRLLAGPLLAWLIMEGLLQPALVGIIIAGASDWFDGYIARRQGIDSIFGTYLDPLADKVLICCIAFSMAQAGYLPLPLVALVIARDAALIAGSFVLIARNVKWQVTSFQEFFDIAKGSLRKVEPLYISKINTVFQLALVGVALLQPALGIEDSHSLIPLLSWCVAFTTCTSFMAYGWKLLQKTC